VARFVDNDFLSAMGVPRKLKTWVFCDVSNGKKTYHGSPFSINMGCFILGRKFIWSASGSALFMSITTHIQHNCFKPCFHRRHNTSQKSAPAPSQKNDFVFLDLLSCFQVVDSPANIFPPHNHVIFIKKPIRSVNQISEIIVPFIGAFVNGNTRALAAFYNKINTPQAIFSTSKFFLFKYHPNRQKTK
jgi:hypothetical protein